MECRGTFVAAEEVSSLFTRVTEFVVGYPAGLLPTDHMRMVVVPPSVLLLVTLQTSLPAGSSASGRLVGSDQSHYFLQNVFSLQFVLALMK